MFYNEHGYIYSNGTMTDLGTLDGCERSQTLGINAGGLVVGFSYTLGDDNSYDGLHAFLYRDGALVDLDSLVDSTSHWVLEEATAINDSGQIVGYGINASGVEHAFLLTPNPRAISSDSPWHLYWPAPQNLIHVV